MKVASRKFMHGKAFLLCWAIVALMGVLLVDASISFGKISHAQANSESTSSSEEAVAETPFSVSWTPPASHTGADFTFRLSFSEQPKGFSYRYLRSTAVTAEGGRVMKTKRVKNVGQRNQHWDITIRPSGNGDVRVSFSGPAIVAKDDGQGLENTSMSASIAGPRQRTPDTEQSSSNQQPSAENTAVNSETQPPQTQTQQATAVPDAPAAPVITKVTGPTSVNVSWTAPNDNGSAITRYRLTYKHSDGTGLTAYLYTSSKGTAISGHLNTGKAYTFKVAAQNEHGWSDDSASVEHTIAFVGVQAVQNLAVSFVDSQTATLTWNLPANWTSGPFGPADVEIVHCNDDNVCTPDATNPYIGRWTCMITGKSSGRYTRSCTQALVAEKYEVQFRVQGASEWTTVSTTAEHSMVTSHTLTYTDGFVDSQSYEFRVVTVPYDADLDNTYVTPPRVPNYQVAPDRAKAFTDTLTVTYTS